WMIERYPVDELVADETADGRSLALMPVVSEQWLARLLLRLGPEAEVVEPPRWRDLARRTAASVLAAYDRTNAAS
ncbi:MAG TPA: WYL domain-containing protein, partial [Ilumatobacteraceae bacterium]